MSLKSLAHRATAKAGRSVLTAQKHSPVVLFGLGVVGVGASVFMACKATLKLNDVLSDAENELKKVEVTVTEGDETKTKASLNVRLQTAIKVARLYAPSALVGFAAVGAMTGSHIILQRRNAGAVAAYAVLDASFKGYRKRVIEDQGAEKDFEYLNGVAEREIVEEGPSGPEVKNIKGLDQDALQAMDPELMYGRVFAPLHMDGSVNTNWSDIPNQNQFFLNMIQSRANDLLRLRGYLFLNDVYDLFGFKKTKAGQVVGWVKNPKDGKGDGWVDFGTWDNGVFAGKEWITGNPNSFWLNFNVDGVILDILNEE